jgi:hypothetical protein
MMASDFAATDLDERGGATGRFSFLGGDAAGDRFGATLLIL